MMKGKRSITGIMMEDHLYGLLFAAIGQTDLDLPKSISKDIRAGIQYALSTLEEGEQEILRLRYAERRSVRETAALLGKSQENVLQMESAAFAKLRLPGRWNYIRFGIAGYMRKRGNEEYYRGYRSGFYEGYEKGLQEAGREKPGLHASDDILNLPIEALEIPIRVVNSLRRANCERIRDLVVFRVEKIQWTRNLGPKYAGLIAKGLRSYGICDTAWDMFLSTSGGCRDGDPPPAGDETPPLQVLPENE